VQTFDYNELAKQPNCYTDQHSKAPELRNVCQLEGKIETVVNSPYFHNEPTENESELLNIILERTNRKNNFVSSSQTGAMATIGLAQHR
jgi:hypothetical protein